MFNNNQRKGLKAWVRFDGNGNAVAGSLIFQKDKPKVGKWKEYKDVSLCCPSTDCNIDYSPWRIVTGGEAGDGTVLIDDPDEEGCPAYTFIGPNDAQDNGWVYLTRYYPTTTCLEINYEWTSFDNSGEGPPTYDRPVYWTSGTEPTGLPGSIVPRVSATPEDGTWEVVIPGGQWFALGIYSTDSCCGRGFLSVEICEVECPTTTTTTTELTTTTTSTTETPSTTTTTSTTTQVPTTTTTTTTAYDPDAQAFFTAADITDETQRSAVNTFVVSSKANGYWSKLRVVFPFVGGDATRHAFDLISATSKMSWSGSLIHNADGVEADIVSPPQTSTGIGIMNFNMNSLTVNSHSMHFYRRDNADYGNSWIMGVSDDGDNNYYIMQMRNVNMHTAYSGSAPSSSVSVFGTDSRGLFSMSRTADNVFKLFRNGSQIGSTQTATNLKGNLNQNFGIFCRNSTLGDQQAQPAKCAFTAVGDGLTDAELTNLYNDVQAMEVTLGRSV